MSYQVIKVQCTTELAEILMAELSYIGFDSFLENEEGFEGSIEASAFDRAGLETLMATYTENHRVSFSLEAVEKQNWNKLWEENFPWIEISDQCVVRAPFHQLEKQYEHELVIMPKMSFGTGHHATTTLMLRQQMQVPHGGKRVLDAGSGTGILAIMALKLGAKEAYACDIEEWAVENAIENAGLNQTELIVWQGTAESYQGEKLDILLANITLNVILEELPVYAHLLKPGSYFLCSGFYQQNCAEVENKASALGFQLISTVEKDSWAGMTFRFQP